MSTYTVQRAIEAPVHAVFETIADPRNFSKAVPNVTKVEFLTQTQQGAGTRFRETRLMNGREATNVLEVTEYEKDRLIRLVSDAGGTIWDTVFRVEPSGKGTELSMVMEARPKWLLPRLMNWMIGGMLRRVLASDMDAVKAYCERAAR